LLLGAIDLAQVIDAPVKLLGGGRLLGDLLGGLGSGCAQRLRLRLRILGLGLSA
jgi:hypothetical protein